MRPIGAARQWGPPREVVRMLQQMREWFRYLKWLLLVIVFMFIWWAVNVWGGGGFRNRSETPEWAARVNGTTISIPSFQAYARRLDSTYQSLLGDQYAQQRSVLRIGVQAINALIDDELAFQEAVREGVGASPHEVADAITRDPSFQENGRFVGLERYRNLFRAGRVTMDEYEEEVRRGLIIAKFRSLIEDGVTVSDAEVEQEFLHRNAKESVDYILADPAKVSPGAAPTEAEIARAYEAHKDRYSLGEGRRGLYVLLAVSNRASSATDAEIKAAYDRDLSSRYTVQEQRRASHILIKVDPSASSDTVKAAEAKAREALKRARAGEDFASLAKRYSQDGTAPNGGDLGFFSRGQMVKEFEDAAFALPVGGVSDLVRTPYGFHVIKVTDSRPGRTIPLEEAREAIRKDLGQAKARSEIARRATDLARAASGGKLDAVAKSQGLTVGDTGAVHDGEALPGLAASQAVVTRMMSLRPGDVSEPVPVPSGQVVVQVTAIVPPAARPLAQVHDRVLKDVRDERARASVDEAVQAARRSGGMKALAKALKAEIRTQADLSHGAGLPGVPADPTISRQLASLPEGAVGDPVITSAGVLVLSVTRRSDHRDELASQHDSIRDGLVRQRQDRLYRAVLQRLRERGDIAVNEEIVRSLDRA
jgi:peptidyl-prolyl cis-trans isomerase D